MFLTQRLILGLFTQINLQAFHIIPSLLLSLFISSQPRPFIHPLFPLSCLLTHHLSPAVSLFISFRPRSHHLSTLTCSPSFSLCFIAQCVSIYIFPMARYFFLYLCNKSIQCYTTVRQKKGKKESEHEKERDRKRTSLLLQAVV